MKLRNGKYDFYIDDDGNLKCRRHGEDWRGFLGDNAVLALFQHARDLEERVASAIKQLKDE